MQWRAAVVAIWIPLAHSEQAFPMLEIDARERKPMESRENPMES
jgi:hypothetical protein